MADDQAVTRVVVTPTSVTIEQSGGDWVPMLGAALDALAAAALVPAQPGPAAGISLQHQPDIPPHRDMRFGGQVAPVRAENT